MLRHCLRRAQWLLTLESKQTRVLARVLGGQGTINVPCWSPDGRRIAFVTYQWIP
ncbi:MAG TPA: hypothetical protein VMT52_13565 [Planctomycetota bacterium]|nr:hypothetical protein [Planctomycetota bacterium]